MTSKFAQLHDDGFRGHQTPFINTMSPNITKDFDDYHISYARYISEYGSDTTAIVLEHHIFFVLNGNHASALNAVSQRSGLQGCIDYFIEHINEANHMSEHLVVLGLETDIVKIKPKAEDILGQWNIARLAKAQEEQQPDNTSA
ncbi:hypothetical protein C9975_07800 [Thalassospira xiamenensis]|nr:hypothetical protein C9975_07800 [Thalassospira xiamenensis]